MAKQKDGGVAQQVTVEAKISDSQKSSMLAIPMEDIRKAKAFKAQNINEFIKEIDPKVSVKLKEINGSTVAESIHVKTMEDIDLNTVTQKSPTLSGQKIEQEFLLNFIEEWKNSPEFKEQFVEILNDSERKEQILKTLKELRGYMDKNEKPTPIIQFLNSING